ncbi:16913_t:CDS:2, partial [Funneliformis caledonium]
MNNIICEVMLSICNKDKLNIHKASQFNIIKTINVLKEHAQQTNDKPVQIIQSTITDTSQEVYPYFSSHNAFRQSIRRIRNMNLPAVSESLRDLVIHKNLKKTLDSSDFLVKDSIV